MSTINNPAAQGRAAHKLLNPVGHAPDVPWNGYFKFSLTRNLWDRVVSKLSREAPNNPELKPARKLHHRLGVPFDEFRRDQ